MTYSMEDIGKIEVRQIGDLWLIKFDSWRKDFASEPIYEDKKSFILALKYGKQHENDIYRSFDPGPTARNSE